MAGELEGETAIITGAGGGIGRAISLLFAKEGARIVVSDFNDELGQETLSAVKAAGGDATYVHCDVAKPGEVAALVDSAEKALGGVSIMINNAGIEGPVTPIAEYSEEDFDRIAAINLRGVFCGIKHGAAAMLRGGKGGAIVNLASVAGLIGAAGIAPYVMTKHGVIGLTKSAALEYAPEKIRVNAVCPGLIDTRMLDELFTGMGGQEAAEAMTAAVPMARLGTAQEVAELILWLSSKRSTYCTGGFYTTDGGFTAQ